jgi:hypothetical protein
MKNRLILLLVILVTLAAILFLAHRMWIHSQMLKSRLTLVEHQVDGFNVRTLMLKGDDGRQRGMASTYWKAGTTLATEDIDKILEANAESATWTQESDDDLYRRWIRSDGNAGATHRKLDGKLCIFTADFAAWSTRSNLSPSDAGILAKVME